MCGIAGLFHLFDTGPVTEDMLRPMCSVLAHRGPDDAGLWISRERHVGFAHRRLAIIDLSDVAAQPMASDDGLTCVTFNGEIYNHLELRAELRQAGYRFRTDHSDTEVLIHGYVEWGIDRMLQRLDGDFAFAIWDGRQQQLFLARDPIGIKPLYYSISNNVISFSSEIKALLALPGQLRAPEPLAMLHYASFLAAPAPFTLFQGIFKLPAGYYLCAQRGAAPQSRCYWDAWDVAARSATAAQRAHHDQATEREYVAAVRSLLRAAVHKRMMSDVPVGVLLSGGVDSAANLALMSESSSKPIDTFTVGYEDDTHLNELDEAQAISRHFGGCHHEIRINVRQAQESWQHIAWHQDEPLADWVCIPLYHVAGLANRAGVHVVQVGEGSDEQFSGYPGYLAYSRAHRRYWEPYVRWVPGAIARAAATSAGFLARKMGRGFAYADMLQRAADKGELFLGGALAFLDPEKEFLFDLPHYRNLISATPITQPPVNQSGGISGQWPLNSGEWAAQLLTRPQATPDFPDELTRMIYLEFRQRLPELLLMRVDKMTMAHSVEARVPFLDKALVGLTMGISAEYKIRGNQPKYLLREALRGIVPDSVLNRRKVGFGAPVADWLRGPFGALVESEITTSQLGRDRLVNLGYVKKLFMAHRARRRDCSVQLWTVYNLVTWYERWFGSANKWLPSVASDTD